MEMIAPIVNLDDYLTRIAASVPAVPVSVHHGPSLVATRT
jgi:hypothetical protein